MAKLPSQFRDRLTNRASVVIGEAGSIKPNSKLAPASLFASLASSGGTIAFNSLRQFGVAPKELVIPSSPLPALRSIDFQRKTLESFTFALREASLHQHRYIGTEHLLFGLLLLVKHNESTKKTLENFLTKKLSHKKIDMICAHLQTIMSGSSKLNPTEDNFSSELVQFAQSHVPADNQNQSNEQTTITMTDPIQTETQESLLNEVATDLVEMSSESKPDPVVGRDRETQSLIRVLSRKSKHNAILIGKPGVGKTALVKHLAYKISLDQVPEQMKNKPLFSLNLSQILSGTSYRGEFEAKMKEVLEEATERGAILFIDEIHTIIGAGATPGSLDAANILKPILTDSSLQIIGATTLAEYKQYWERDRALERRFHPILLGELSASETLEVLKRLAPSLEKYYSVSIPSEVLKYVISLTNSHLPNRSLPDKAIDILDEACAHVSSTLQSKTPATPTRNTQQQLQQTTSRKQEALESGNFDIALKELSNQSKLENSIKKAKSLQKKSTNSPQIVTNDDVAFVVAQFTHSDPQHLLTPKVSHAVTTTEHLKREIFGQDKALEVISSQLMNASISRSAPGPVATFFFSGQEGVGKTSTSHAIAAHYFGVADATIYYDLSEFSEPHSTSRLFGSPPGYVGYSESNTLVDKLREKPRSVLIFDNVERAHPSVVEQVARIMKLQSVADTNGSEASLSHVIVIAIANVPVSDLGNIGFEDTASSPPGKVNQKKPKLSTLQTLHSTAESSVSFDPISTKAGIQIASRTLRLLQRQLKEQNISLSYHGSVARYFAQKYPTEQGGASHLKRGIDNEVKNLTARHLLQDNIDAAKPTRIKIAIDEQHLVKK